MDHSSWVIRDPSLHLLFSHQATEIQFFFLPLASMARGNFRACFYYLLIFFFFFFCLVVTTLFWTVFHHYNFLSPGGYFRYWNHSSEEHANQR